MAIQFSFQYCIDPKDHKSWEDYKAIAVEGAIWPKLAGAKDWLVQPCKSGKYHLNIKTLQVLFVIMPAHHFFPVLYSSSLLPSGGPYPY